MTSLLAPLETPAPAAAQRRRPGFRKYLIAAIILVALLAISFGITYLFGLFSHIGAVVRVDRDFDRFVDTNRSRSLFSVMNNVTLLGSYTVDYSVAAAASVIICLLSRRLLPLPVLMLALPVEIFLQKEMAKIVHSGKPSKAVSIGQAGGYFSGGSARTFIICGLAAYFFGWVTSERLERLLMWIVTGLAVLVEGVSRLYLGRHFGIDILGGWLIGGLMLVSAIAALEQLQPDPLLRLGWSRRLGARAAGRRGITFSESWPHWTSAGGNGRDNGPGRGAGANPVP